jgi:putative oxidoreductase
MHRLLWVLQILFGLYFVAIGVMHFVVPDGLPEQMGWMYDLSTSLHVVAGVAEILGGLGLILPGLTRVRPELTVAAAAGLAVVMLAAAVWHLDRGEAPNIAINLVNAAVLAFIAYQRWRPHPLTGNGRPNRSRSPVGSGR